MYNTKDVAEAMNLVSLVRKISRMVKIGGICIYSQMILEKESFD